MKLDNLLEYSEPQGRYKLVKGRWIGVIFRENALEQRLILSVGEEKNRRAIKNWISLYLKNRCWETNNESEVAPDMHDRANIVFN